MQKTYKSKKNADDALDPKDILYGCEESAFNALYINNIKQTRKELSCFGTSNQHFLPVKKLNKRKYVKRLGRDVDVETRSSSDSTNKSTYLTPDKSIHVNKGSDLFDQLLNTSASPQNTFSAKKDDPFDQLLSKQDPNFTLSPLSKSVIKKINCSTESEEDTKNKNAKKTKKKQKKKFSKNIKFKPLNESNINDYDLIVEQERRIFNIDNSITNILSEKPLLKRESFINVNDIYVNTPIKPKYKINRLTENILSQSPSTSTPMFKKYCSQSIHQCSPIQDDCTIHNIYSENENKENKTEDKNSQTIINKEFNRVLHISPKELSQQFSPILKKSATSDSKKNNHETDTNEDNKIIEDTNTSIILSNNFYKYRKKTTDDIHNYSGMREKESTSLNLSVPQESFLGFTCNSMMMQNNLNNVSDSFNNQDVERLKSAMTLNYQEKISFDTPSSQKWSKNISTDLFNSIESINDKSVSENADAIFNALQKSSNNTRFFDAQSNDSSIDNNSLSDLRKQCLNRQPFVRLLKLDVLDILDKNRELPKESILPISLNSNESTNSDYMYENKSLRNINSNNYIENKLNICNETESYEAIYNNNNSSNESIDRCISFVTTRKRNDVTNISVCFLNYSSLNSSKNSNKTVLSLNNGEYVDEDDEVNISSTNLKEASNLVNNYNLNDSVLNLSSDYFNKHDISLCSNHNSTNESLNISKETKYPINETHKDISIREDNESVISINDNEEDKYNNINNDVIQSDNSLEEIKNVTNDIISPTKSTINKKNKGKTERWTESYSRPPIILQAGKKWERSLSIYKRMTLANDNFDTSLLDDSLTSKGRKYRQSVIDTMELQDQDSIYKDSQLVRKSFWPTVTIVNDSNFSSTSLCQTKYEDISEFLRQDCDDTLAELSKLSIGSSDQDITVIEKESSVRVVTARDYVLRRCQQTDAILFDECYPDTLLKNCHKIGEGVYGEVFLWRAGDGSVRVLKVIPVAGDIKVNGEQQKDFSEIISEIVIAMELSALRTPIAELESHFKDGKDISSSLDLLSIENATDVFNEVIGVKCVYGSYPSRLLDLWDLYDECKGSENDNPAILPVDQQFIVLELANAGQDLEGYQFANAEQAYALFIQIAFGLAVGEEAFQFEHRDLHWGNVLISPTEEKWSLFVIRGRTHRVRRCGVRATIIDYSLSRLSLSRDERAPCQAALYNDLAHDTALFSAHGDYQFQVYRLMQERLRNDWKNFEPYTNILWLHYTVDKMITALRYKRVDSKIHKQYIIKLKGIRDRILNYQSCVDFILTDKY